MHEQFPSHLWFHVALLCAVPTGPTVGRGREGGGCGRGGGERYRGGAGWESSQGGGRGRGGGTDWGRLWELSGDSKKEVKGVDVFISTMKSGCPALYRMLKFYMESLCSTPILGLYLSTLCCSPINQRSAIAVTTFCVLNCDAFEACIEDVRGRCWKSRICNRLKPWNAIYPSCPYHDSAWGIELALQGVCFKGEVDLMLSQMPELCKGCKGWKCQTVRRCTEVFRFFNMPGIIIPKNCVSISTRTMSTTYLDTYTNVIAHAQCHI